MATGTPQIVNDLSVGNVLEGYYDVTTDATGKRIGTLPKYAVIDRVLSHTPTGWNGTLPTAKLGWASDTDALATEFDTMVASTGLRETASGTLETGLLNAPMTDDKDVIVTAAEGGSTAGLTYFAVYYHFPFSKYVVGQ